MTFRKILFFIFVIFSALAFSQTPCFNADSVYSTIHHLSVTIGPRPMGSLNERRALKWAAGQFQRFGADTAYVMTFNRVDEERSSVNTRSGTAVGVFKGKTDSTIVVGGHIDSDAWDIPGANDNASGTACAMELARIWSQRDRQGYLEAMLDPARGVLTPYLMPDEDAP